MSNQSLTDLLSNPAIPYSPTLSQQQEHISIYDCNPGGNYTYIVCDTQLLRTNYLRLDHEIRTAYPYFEQGGFIESPTNNESVLRLQMAGGEFCGNAIRCCAALITQDYLAERKLQSLANYSLLRQTPEGWVFPIEISGVDQPLLARCSIQNGEYLVRAEMPWKIHFSKISEKKIIWQDQELTTVIVQMQGITHILIDETSFPFLSSADQQRSLITMAINQCQLEEESAIGLIWYSSNNIRTGINPVVWVRDIDTCIYESACGSGTFALALNKLKNSPAEEKIYDIEQPSGANIRAIAAKSIEQAKFISASIEGFVSIKSLPSLPINLKKS